MRTQDPFIPARPPGQDELPCDDGEPMDTPRHRLQMQILIESLEDAWCERSDFYVGGNMFVYFSQLQLKRHDFRGPDVFVVLDTERKSRKCWVAWEEGGQLPDVVIELTSESTVHIDHGEKKRVYAKIWRLPAYFIFDPLTCELEAYRLEANTHTYVPIEPDARGDYPVEVLGLSLGLRPGKVHLEEGQFLRWLDDHAEPLPTPGERADAQRERANAERARADAEQERADAERERADAERERADAERERAERAEARLQELLKQA